MKFRDRKTGRFVSRSTWKRSKAKGGIRYVRFKSSTLEKTVQKRRSITKADQQPEKQKRLANKTRKRKSILSKRSAEFKRRSEAAKLGWKRRRQKERKRKKREITPPPPPSEFVTYFKYDPKDGKKKIDIRIVTDGPFNKKDLTNIIEITVKGKTYSGKDLESFHALTWTAAHQRRD